MIGTSFRRLVGAALIALSVLPVFRVLDPGTEAPFREASVELAESTLAFVTWGGTTLLLVAVVLTLVGPTERARSALIALGDRLAGIALPRFAVGLGVISGALAGLVDRMLYRGYFTNVDEIAQALHARYLAEGALGGPLPDLPEAWLIPNMLMTDVGWVSQFPPGHLGVMALGLATGTLKLWGPVSLAAMVSLFTLSLPRLLPDRPRLARAAAVAVALSPFMILIGGGSMSHTTAGLAGAAVLYAALRARDGSAWWGVAAGAAVGVMVLTRPWTGLVLGTTATLGVWLPGLLAGGDASRATFLRRSAATVVGGAPFAVILGWYHHAVFGSATTLGYLAAFGERHRLGFHMDPWGYDYSWLDGIGFTSADLLGFGTQLLELPVPVGAVVGTALLLGGRLPTGVRLLLAYALVPVVANGLYWFHDTRMLYEAAPAWAALTVWAACGLSEWKGGAETRLPPRDIALWASVVAVVTAVGFGVPTRLASYGWSEETLARVTVPTVPEDGRPALIFVHASWNERLSSGLQGAGEMRQDSVISTLRRNTNCDLQLYAEAREARFRDGDADVVLPTVDLEQLPGTPAGIERPPTPEGTTLRVREGDFFPPSCLTQLRSDRFGGVALAPLLWQGDLPGIETGAPMFVRDLGPEKNARLLQAFPNRTPWVFVPKAPDAAPELSPYAEAMQVLWGAPAGG